jgi:two-component system cell cycle sensor histidine kinase/response regulator CckA
VDFQRVESSDGLRASLTARTWDLIVSDFSMPRFSGTEALKLVRSKGCDAPFIFVSGTIGEDSAVAALKDGAQDYLVKDNLKRLVPAVQRELKEAEEHRQRKRLDQHMQQLQKFEAIGRLAGGVAHDFNNLLGVMLGQSELLLDRPHDEGFQHGLEMIRGAARRGASLTRQLLAFGRRQVMDAKVVNLNVVLSNFESLLRRVIGEDIELDFQTEAKLSSIEADPSQLEQVVMNLAINARDAMPTGGKLNIGTANLHLDGPQADYDGVAKPGSYVRVVVSDTGCGMDEETRARLFEPFFTTKEQGKGTGLGLPTVSGIVKQSGGYIGVASEPGRGTSFKIYFPVAAAVAETLRSRERKEEPPRGLETILVADDDVSLREVTCEFLRSGGYRVISAESPEDALRLAESHPGPIDLLLTDMMMPKMNGGELAARLGKMRPGIKVMYISGHADGLVAGGASGLVEPRLVFLQKPFTRAEVMMVREILDSRAMVSATESSSKLEPAS